MCLGRVGASWWLGGWAASTRRRKLVRRQASAWRKYSLLWAVVGEEASLFLTGPARLTLSALGSSYSASGRPSPCAVAGCLRWKGLLFAVPPAQG